MGDIRFGQTVLNFSFPLEWSEAVMQGAKSAGAGGQATPMVSNPFYQGDNGGGPQPQQQSYGRSSSDTSSHVHPDIRESLQECHECYAGWVAVQRLLEATNLTLKDLPYLTNLVNAAGKTGYVPIIAWGCASMDGSVCFGGKGACLGEGPPHTIRLGTDSQVSTRAVLCIKHHSTTKEHP